MRRVSIPARQLRRAAAVTTVSVLAAIGPVAAAPPVLAAGLAGGEEPPALSGPPDLRPDVGLDGGPQPKRYRSTNAGMYGPGLWHHAPAGRTWYGAYFSLPGSSLSHAAAYCIDAGLKSPYPQYFTQADGQTLASAETAWALSAHSSADDAGIQAALAAIARLDENLEHDHAIAPAEPGELGAEFAEAAEAYAHITKDAADLAGPYRVELSLGEGDELALDGPATPQPATDPAGEPAEAGSSPFYRPLQARVSVVSASGETLDDIPLTVEVSGGAVEETELRSAAEPLIFSVRPDRGSTEPVAVTVTATGLPATDVIVYDPIDPQTGEPAARVQSIVTAGEPTTASASAEHTIEPAPPIPPMTPPIVTVPPIESPPATEPPPTQEPPQETTPAPETTAPPETQEPPETQTPPTQTQPAETQPPSSTTPPPPAPTTPPEDSPEHRTAAPPPPPTTRPQAEAPTSDELPRTGPVGTGAALGSALLLLGCGIAAITVARGLKRED
ncbi:hypothetical protein [Brevibacterium luteolum]|uniref:hypothetical protein n=1 Tax=Brevibacterium luteolum TaxID=199591 RepID=UPI00195A93FD|nr:hypothetical protein [Brevibacterium luteolum]MBM7530469.1 hypothetical protein [Brevibacterium luteolum]